MEIHNGEQLDMHHESARPAGIASACRRACREHPVSLAAAGLAVAATLALVCVGLMRHHR